MISTPDGRKTLTASLTTKDLDPAAVFPQALGGLIQAVFCADEPEAAPPTA
jgi:D-alanyl-D-alanine carboxypeptidase